ncbi:odorant receptor 93 [Tribolium castaneum]|uniref:Odorant receptor n=1 Tax=Tribolium castaneum TaxID=7070 RepID=D2A352_TRICA|nr:odorant receptor 93 [Tribolium castaneum]
MTNLEIKICRATLKILKYSLIWPNEADEMNPGKWYYIRVATFLLITSLWVLSVFMHIVMSIIHDADVHLSEDVAFCVAFCGLYYMTMIYVKNQPKVALLLRDLSKFQFGKPPGFEEKERILGFLSQFFFYYCVMAVMVYNLVKLLQKPDCEKMNEIKGLKENCGLLTPTWLPFDINYFPAFHLTFLYVFISTQILMKLALIISFNALEMAYHVILRIDHLKIMITECLDQRNYEVSRRKLKTCILYHLEILSLSNRLNDCFSNIMFAHLTITAAICGCLEKQFVDGDNRLGALLHVCGWISALFVACIGGQHLLNASLSIPDAIWSSKWYEADVRIRKDLLFMMAKSQVGLHLNVGSFGVLSFSVFFSVLKMSYSILAMLTS